MNDDLYEKGYIKVDEAGFITVNKLKNISGE